MAENQGMSRFEAQQRNVQSETRAESHEQTRAITESKRDPGTGYRYMRRAGYHSPRRTYRGF